MNEQAAPVINVAIAGALGRTGRCAVERALVDERFNVVAALAPPGSAQCGQSITHENASTRVSDRLTSACDVIVDFSTTEGTMAWLEHCVRDRIAFVSGVTGLSQQQMQRFEQAASKIPILHESNFSLGVAVLRLLARQAAGVLGEEYDIEIVETHHRMKADAPSGTALSILRAIEEGRKGPAPTVFGRHGTSLSRPPREIGIHAVRMGQVVGKHRVQFGGPGETISICHESQSRHNFAAGALAAAAWLVQRTPGLYCVNDMLNQSGGIGE